jgi:Tfp pilus assembly protein PilF
MRILHITLVAAFATVLAGCESAPVKSIQQGISGLFQQGGNKGEQDLASGIKQYEDGNYAQASRLLQSGLDKGLSSSDQVRAHKYLAFIHCVSGREARCRDEFRTALDLNPSFELAAAESGHPIWGPVFRSVKSRR